MNDDASRRGGSARFRAIANSGAQRDMVEDLGIELSVFCAQDRRIPNFPIPVKNKTGQIFRPGGREIEVIQVGSGPRAHVCVDGPLGHDWFRAEMEFLYHRVYRNLMVNPHLRNDRKKMGVARCSLCVQGLTVANLGALSRLVAHPGRRHRG